MHHDLSRTDGWHLHGWRLGLGGLLVLMVCIKVPATPPAFLQFENKIVSSIPTAAAFSRLYGPQLCRPPPSHIDTFVCLRGGTFATNYYAAAAAAAAGLPCNTLFFPIKDFHVTREAGVVAPVLELRRRLPAGERAYIHCR